MRNLIRLSSCRGGGNAALRRARVRLNGPVVDRPSLDRPILDRKELRMAFETLEVGGVGAGQPGLGADPEDLLVERPRSEEHTSELQSLMRISYAVFCLKKKH